MKRIKIDLIVPIVFLLIASFVFGFVGQDVVASAKAGRDKFGVWVSSLQALPQKLESIAAPAPESEGPKKPLPIIETYSSVIERLKADYYGKEINEKELTYDAIRGLLFALNDPFTRFLDPESYKKMREENEGNFTGIGAVLDTNKDGQIYIKEPLPDTPAMKAGVKSNDIILAVDGKPIRDIDIEEVVKMIRGKQGTKVRLTLMRPGKPKPFDITIVRQVVQFQMVKYRMIDDKQKIGYIRLYQFNEQSDQQFDKALTALEKQHVKGLILDLRSNPGGLLQVAVDIGSRFIESGPIVIIQERGGQKSPLFVKEEKHNHKRYPLVVLVDKSSASASEIVSGAIKDTNTGTLVGTRTFGKGRVQTIISLQDGSAVAITTAKYLTPSGTDIHKKGIEPDYKVEPSENFDPNNPETDIQLTKAVEVLKVKMGILPKSVLDKIEQTARADAKKN